MGSKRNTAITPHEAREAALAKYIHGGVTAGADALGISRPAMQRRLRKADMWGISPHGEMIGTTARQATKAGVAKSFILTSAQSNTYVHGDFWRNLQVLAEHRSAEIMVARLRYNHTPQQVAQEKVSRAPQGALWYDDELKPYLIDDRVEIAPGLIWAGDMNIIPTATDPLSGLDSFTGTDSCVFPHTQVSLKSVATAPGTSTKFNYTTGAVTLKNYIQRKAGKKAEFHHAYAALLVEVDTDGDWFVRQINATDAGDICDLDVFIKDGEVSTGQRAEVLTVELHGRQVDPQAFQTMYGDGGLVDALQPRNQVLHDVLDFGSRSHHNTFFDVMEAHYHKEESVEGECETTAEVINRTLRPDMETWIAKGNHDEHMDRWLETADFKRDPVNAGFFIEAMAAKLAALRDRDTSFDLTAWALGRAGIAASVCFLGRLDELEIAGIRHDQHGDVGPNGSRGSIRNTARLGQKTNIGHSHSAGIFHGCYQNGTLSLLDMGYNRGPSSWSHSVIVTYHNGKRAIVTLKNGKWRAS